MVSPIPSANSTPAGADDHRANPHTRLGETEMERLIGLFCERAIPAIRSRGRDVLQMMIWSLRSPLSIASRLTRPRTAPCTR